MDQIEKRKKVICDLINDPLYVPMKEKELAAFLQVKREDRAELRNLLIMLQAEGRISQTQKGKFIKADGHILSGTFISNKAGFGFVEIEGQEEDYFIPEEYTDGAFHKDVVQIVPIGGESHKEGRRREAKIVKILARGITTLVGTYDNVKGNFGFVVPDNSKIANDIFIPGEASKNAVSGHKVVVEITDYGDGKKNPEGKVIEILGHINDPGVDIMSIVRGYELPVDFSERIFHQVERVAKDVTEADRVGRRDLRDVMMVTIDGEDAKDLDDAVNVSFDGSLYTLGVHIADVTNYVQEGSALDREALKRGTSVYLVDRVIPMLPHALSNGICSLNAGEDRLALSCIMKINMQGEVVDYEITESVIRVSRRMSYHQVYRILSEGEESDQLELRKEAGPELCSMFSQMADLAAILGEKRKERGAIDFDFPECKIILDQDGHPIQISAYERNVATNLIEEFMLAANETIAQHFYWLELPFVYRVHDVPDGEKIAALATFISNLGITMKAIGKRKSKVGSEEVHPKEIQKLLTKIIGTPQEAMVSRLALRSMKQAKYSTECTGHFGLATSYYCHFTSPIRRYPDLQIHRIIKEQLRGRLNEDRIMHYKEILPEVCKQSSTMERRADEAERETNKLKKVEYMENKTGQAFEGVISSVTGWGIYVELPNTVEGLVHISKIPGDYYVYREKDCEIVGEGTGRVYRLGMPVKVMVESCDRFSRTIDFRLAGEEEY